MAERIRVVVAKPGLDGHDRGAKVVARALRDAGMEVIYTGLHQTPEQIVQTVIQEDADAVGLSVLSGAHMTLFARLMQLLEERGVTDVVVFGGGIIPDADIPELEAMGVAKVFTPGASMDDIVQWVRSAPPQLGEPGLSANALLPVRHRLPGRPKESCENGGGRWICSSTRPRSSFSSTTSRSGSGRW
jgi:methylmalonyl-CoA mutase C-terminal domain/subunit